ncbi:MAG TPA: acetate/propionate family kinase [Candidatus Saccharimonadales bacterium]|nr:acetate/propionate family kinase [Candidatus Saccharimonadales bacterium]
METADSSDGYILTVNAGSSSIKLGVFSASGDGRKVFEAAIQGIGSPPNAELVLAGGAPQPAAATSHMEAARLLLDLPEVQAALPHVIAAGHRIVHGGPDYYQTQDASSTATANLQRFAAFDPAHLPAELRLVEVCTAAMPGVRQVLCFDTAFHHGLPRRAQLLPIPRHFAAKGVRRYGFHGLSYAYIVDELRRVEGEAAANGKVIIAHLGSGASLAALENGASVDTTMGMTPASGIPMATRSGDLDPGLALYLAQTEGYDAARFNHMANFESGLLGVSGTTADMKTLLETEAADAHAKDAVDLFCYQAKKAIGGFAAALGGLNTLVFTGGMGENAPKIRARICSGLEFLGITIDAARNQDGARLISADGGLVGVHVIHTDEAVTIAAEVRRYISKDNK